MYSFWAKAQGDNNKWEEFRADDTPATVITKQATTDGIILLIPGFSEDDVDVTVSNGYITITGENEDNVFKKEFIVPKSLAKVIVDVTYGILTCTFEFKSNDVEVVYTD